MPAAITDKFADTYNAANPNVARVTSTRSAAGTSLSCDNLSGWPTGTVVHFSTYQLNTSNQVVAGTQIDWVGIVSGSTIGSLTRITGATDNGSAVGDVVEMNPTAKWASNLVNGILVGHNQDGTHATSLPLTTPKITTSINDANGNEVIRTPATSSAVNDVTVTNAATGSAPVISATGDDSAVNLNLRGKGLAKTVTIGAGAATIFPYDYVVSGCVWSGDAYASTRAASMTSGVVVINGNPVTVAAVTARTFTASKDTYVDVLDNGDGTGLLVYTEATNNAASPALASNSIRIAIIVTGASNIANVGSVNQGQEDRVLPIATSVPYAVTDSLGNLICPRDPNRKLLGFRQIVTSQTGITSTSAIQVTRLSCPVIVPTGRKIKISVFLYATDNSTATANNFLEIWDGVVASGTRIAASTFKNSAVSSGGTFNVSATTTPSSSSKTYNAGFYVSTGTAGVYAAATTPSYLMVELV